MTEAGKQGSSLSLSNQVSRLESQLMLRRRRVRSLVTGIPGKLVSRLASPGMLLAGFGAGVALEQAGRHRGRLTPVVFHAASTLIGLLLSRPTPVSQDVESMGSLER